MRIFLDYCVPLPQLRSGLGQASVCACVCGWPVKGEQGCRSTLATLERPLRVRDGLVWGGSDC